MAMTEPYTVYLCDDVADIRLLMRFALEEDPELRVVGEAGDGVAGVQGVAETQPDVVLLDLSMPQLDGLEVIARLRSVAPGVGTGPLGLGRWRGRRPRLSLGVIVRLRLVTVTSP